MQGSESKTAEATLGPYAPPATGAPMAPPPKASTGTGELDLQAHVASPARRLVGALVSPLLLLLCLAPVGLAVGLSSGNDTAAGGLVIQGLGSDAGIVDLDQTIEFMNSAEELPMNP